MDNRFNCYICDTETINGSHQNIFRIRTEHSKRSLVEILKRLRCGDGTSDARDELKKCFSCDNCLDKLNAYDAACLLVKQVKCDLKAIFYRAEERRKHRMTARVNDSQSSESPQMDFEISHDITDDVNATDTIDRDIAAMTSEDEEYDSDDSFVWPKHFPPKRTRKMDSCRGERKRSLFKCFYCPADFCNKDELQVMDLPLRMGSMRHYCRVCYLHRFIWYHIGIHNFDADFVTCVSPRDESRTNTRICI